MTDPAITIPLYANFTSGEGFAYSIEKQSESDILIDAAAAAHLDDKLAIVVFDEPAMAQSAAFARNISSADDIQASHGKLPSGHGAVVCRTDGDTRGITLLDQRTVHAVHARKTVPLLGSWKSTKDDFEASNSYSADWAIAYAISRRVAAFKSEDLVTELQNLIEQLDGAYKSFETRSAKEFMDGYDFAWNDLNEIEKQKLEAAVFSASGEYEAGITSDVIDGEIVHSLQKSYPDLLKKIINGPEPEGDAQGPSGP